MTTEYLNDKLTLSEASGNEKNIEKQSNTESSTEINKTNNNDTTITENTSTNSENKIVANQTEKIIKKTQTQQLQLVDENKEFSKILPEYMKNIWNLEENGFDYHILSIFGSQSTGKSTLLNRLFKTNFQVMNEKSRQQTTKGIWISQAEESSMLILDVEGTDGRERGEEQDFERKSALFTLAISEVLVINLWENMVGLYQGANMGLLKTVLEVNLQLFLQQQGKVRTLLLFVIRDYSGQTPMSNLSEILTNDLNKMWCELSKPQSCNDSKLSDFFDLMFTKLPHKIFLPEQFEQEVIQLKNRFYDKDDENYIFNSRYHRGIPADGFPSYAESIWEMVNSNHDLDIPTQQQLLAEYRCDEIAKEIVESFQDDIIKYKNILEKGEILNDMGSIFGNLRENSLELYDQNAGRYRKDVYKRKRIEFFDKMNTYLHVYYLLQLRNLEKSVYVTFKQNINESLKDDTISFVDNLEKLKSECIKEFTEMAENSKLNNTIWNYNENLNQLEKEIDDYGMMTKIEQIKKIKINIKKSTAYSLSSTVPVKMNELRDTLWEELCNDLSNTITTSIEKYQKSIKGYNCKDNEIENTIIEIRKEAWNIFLSLIVEETSDNLILVRLREKFEEIFRYEKNGLPRIWSTSDDIDSCFNKAKEESLLIITLYSSIDASEQKIRDITGLEDIEKNELVIIDDNRMKQILSKFIREIELQYIDAKRSIVRTTSKVPTWFIVLTIVLGYNEFISLIRNPLYLLIGIVLAVTSYILYYTNLIHPIIRISKVVMKDIWLQIVTFLGEQKQKLNEMSPPSPSTKSSSTIKNEYKYKPIHNSYKQVDKLSHYNTTEEIDLDIEIPLKNLSKRNRNMKLDSCSTLVNNFDETN